MTNRAPLRDYLEPYKSMYRSTPTWTKMVNEVLTTLGVKLSPEWLKAVTDNYRVTLGVAGEGSGKSFTAGIFATIHSVYDTLHGAKLYWVIGRDFEDARKDMEYCLEFQERLENVQGQSMPTDKQQQCTFVTKTNQTFTTVSAYDFTKIGREEPDGIVGAEVSRWEPEIWSRCMGRLARKFDTAWMFGTGSPSTSVGWLPQLAEVGRGPNAMGLKTYQIPTWANIFKYPGGRTDPAILALEQDSSPQYFAERYGGLFVPSGSVILSSFRYHLHVDPDLDYDPNYPVYLAIDPGTKVYSVLFVQLTDDGSVHVVDEIYVQRWTHEQVIDEVRMNPGFVLVNPSQAGAIDVASKQAHMGMPAPYNEWYNDTHFVLWAQKHPVEDSIERLRAVLADNPNTGRPRLSIAPRCKGLISEMAGGVSPVDGGGPWSYFETRNGLGPPRSENNHSCTALAYLLAGPFGTSRQSSFVGPVTYLTSKRTTEGIDEFIRELNLGTTETDKYS